MATTQISVNDLSVAQLADVRKQLESVRAPGATPAGR
jgi:hypothetical protein